MQPLVLAQVGDYNIIWIIVGVLAVIALLMYILGRRG